MKNIQKEIGLIGLGKMGAGVARQLKEKGYKVVVYNRTSEVVKSFEKEGFSGAYSLKELAEKISTPRTVWVMVTHNAMDEMLKNLTPLLQRGDTVIDAGNSPFKDSMERSKKFAKKGINFLDVGFSGGPSGARNGGCLMIGGKKEIYKKYEKLFKDLSVVDGYKYLGDRGAGHFVKMIHNGIEYGMMQAIGEGFEVLKKSKFKLNLKDVANLYNHASVIESRLVGWLEKAFKQHTENLDGVSGTVAHTGEGEWTVKTAKELKVPVKILEES
ncbi:MAG: phosphogluconate dehydrogenase (NAD(+)-dependent, decarboxylating), partial [Patescibacteria group bacterium]